MRQIWELSHFVVFTDSDYEVAWERRKSTSSSKLLCGSHMPRSTSTTQAVIALSSGESEFCGLVKGTSAGLGAHSMLKDLGLEISKNTKIDKAVLEVRFDASGGRGMAVRRGFGTLLLQHCRCRSLHKRAKSKSRKSLESRTPQILEPNILTEDQLEEHWKSVIVTFVKESLVPRCGQE